MFKFSKFSIKNYVNISRPY